jgi:hypothetical protein
MVLDSSPVPERIKEKTEYYNRAQAVTMCG